MKVTGELHVPTIDLVRYKRELGDAMNEIFQGAIRAWITAVTGRVPLWSGMARASLLNISELVNGKVVLSPLKGKSRVPQGEALGTATVQMQFPTYSFSFSSNVEHYVIQEDHNVRATTGRGSPSAPWQSLPAGQAAFEDYLRNVKPPQILITAKVVRIS